MGLILALLAAGHFLEKKLPESGPSATPPKAGLETTNAPAPTVLAGMLPPPATIVPQTSLSRPGGTWEQAGAPPEFLTFAEWTHRHRAAATAGEKAALEAEGVALASARREVLAELIPTDPKRALELTVPFGVRRDLPKSVESLLEERIDARGDLMVIGAIPLPGREGEVPPLARAAKIDGRHFEAYPSGWWLEQSSKHDVPINGIALASRKTGRDLLVSFQNSGRR